MYFILKWRCMGINSPAEPQETNFLKLMLADERYAACASLVPATMHTLYFQCNQLGWDI
jgi:hypothetical protein